MLEKRLRQLRNGEKLKQSELAKLVGVARTTYAMYEQGRRKPDLTTLRTIAEYHDVTTDYLIGLTDEPKAVVDNKNDLHDDRLTLLEESVEDLTDDQIDEVLSMIKYLKFRDGETTTNK